MKITEIQQTFITDTAERVSRTFAQAYISCWAVTGFDFDEILSMTCFKTATVAGILSLAMAFGLKPVGSDTNSASILKD